MLQRSFKAVITGCVSPSLATDSRTKEPDRSIFPVANPARAALMIEASNQELAKTRLQKASGPRHVACISHPISIIRTATQKKQ